MPQDVNCLRCGTTMQPGFIADRTYGENRQEKWSPGEPQQIWGGKLGVKVDRHELIPVTTMRCPNCGALESYAESA